MKNFKGINLNSEKLLKNEELLTLRGGTVKIALCGCRDEFDYTIGQAWLDNCESCPGFCRVQYPQYDHSICVGGD